MAIYEQLTKVRARFEGGKHVNAGYTFPAYIEGTRKVLPGSYSNGLLRTSCRISGNLSNL